jgi:hypothetical protein
VSTLNSVACESSATTAVTVTVQTVPTEGTIAGGLTICNGGNPVAFTSTAAGTSASVGAMISYRWESSTNNWLNATPIAGAIAATYDAPSGLTTTTKYRRYTISTLNTVACESAVTNDITVIVQSAVSAGTISADQTICNGGDPTAFTSITDGNGDGTITYRWEFSTNNWSTATIIAGATDVFYDIPAGLTTTTKYRRITISTFNDVACESISNTITVTVQSVTTAGTISGSQTICNGTSPATFTSDAVATGSGSITYQWQISSDNA